MGDGSDGIASVQDRLTAAQHALILIDSPFVQIKTASRTATRTQVGGSLATCAPHALAPWTAAQPSLIMLRACRAFLNKGVL